MSTQRNGQKAKSAEAMDVAGNVKDILKTMVLLGQNYSARYIIQIMRGDERAQFRKQEHQLLETFGSGMSWSESKLRNLLYYMSEVGLIAPVEPGCFTLTITDSGRKYLDAPWALTMTPGRLALNHHEYTLRFQLMNLRTRMAAEFQCKPYEVFPDWSMEVIIRNHPTTLAQLKKVAGITAPRAEQIGERLLLAVKECLAHMMLDYIRRCKNQVQYPRPQKARELFLEGKSIQDIAEALEVRVSTVAGYLESLHVAGEIDLKPWVEQNVNPRSLYRASEYFRQVESPRLKEAYEVLGLDYQTLRFSRLYVSDYSQYYQELAIAA